MTYFKVSYHHQSRALECWFQRIFEFAIIKIVITFAYVACRNKECSSDSYCAKYRLEIGGQITSFLSHMIVLMGDLWIVTIATFS
jgi:hypothetical protein